MLKRVRYGCLVLKNVIKRAVRLQNVELILDRVNKLNLLLLLVFDMKNNYNVIFYGIIRFNLKVLSKGFFMIFYSE